jgi:hypothetical protein
MSRTTLQNALAELYGLLADSDGNPVATLSALGVAKCYPHEPGAGGWVKPCSITLFPSGIEPTEWTISVRVYVAGDVPPAEAQDFLIDVPVAVMDLLTAGYGPDRWQMGWNIDLDCYLAMSEIVVGREDGF